jgi:DNA-binding transcriptional ArsR family regulator
LRTAMKDFAAGRMVSGTWEWRLDGVETFPYRIGEVLATDASVPVLIPEGEKDVDSLWLLGIAATSNPFGAGKWKPQYNDFLKGRKIIILPDNDEPGRKHAEDVLSQLSGVAASVRIVALPGLSRGGDVSDWLAADHTKDDLLNECVERVEATPTSSLPFTPFTVFTAKDLLSMKLEDPAFIVPGIIPEGLTLLAGKPKVGKSWLALGIALAVATGGNALGSVPVERRSVLYLALEDSPRRLQGRLRCLLNGQDAPSSLRISTQWPMRDEGVKLLEGFIKSDPSIQLIVIDTLARIRGSASCKSNNQYQSDYADLQGLHSLASTHAGLGIVLVHHTRKEDSQDPLELISGTLGLTGCADTALVFKRARQQGRATIFVAGRDLSEVEVGGEFAKDMSFRLLGDSSEVNLSLQRESILKALRSSSEPMGPKEISDQTGISHASVRHTVTAMADDGIISRPSRGLYVPAQVDPTTDPLWGYPSEN